MRKIFTAAIILIAFQLAAGPAIAEMYKWIDKNGVIHFSDEPPPTREKNVETIETPKNTAPAPKPDSAEPRSEGKTDSKSEPKKRAPTRKDILEQNADKVMIFTTSWCGYCKKAIAFLRSHRIRFEQYDIEKDAAAAKMMLALGGRGGVPYAIIKGKAVYGFSESAYKHALGLR